MVGIVVLAMCRIWVNKSVPAMAGARLVVSDNGDILSPKYAPEIMAPAMIPSSNPNAFPIPNKATPTVATVVQLLPVATDTMALIKQAANKNKVGLSTCKP